jgi:hypothetical protein
VSAQIGLWLDTTSDGCGNAHWIVSLDEGDTTHTLATFAEDAYATAKARAEREASARGLQLVELPS